VGKRAGERGVASKNVPPLPLPLRRFAREREFCQPTPTYPAPVICSRNCQPLRVPGKAGGFPTRLNRSDTRDIATCSAMAEFTRRASLNNTSTMSNRSFTGGLRRSFKNNPGRFASATGVCGVSPRRRGGSTLDERVFTSTNTRQSPSRKKQGQFPRGGAKWP